MKRVLLLSLPWATPLEPSLGLGILKGVCQKAEIPCDVYEAHLEMFRWLTHRTYIETAEAWALCEFTFTGAFEATANPRQLEVLDRICRGYDIEAPGAPEAAQRMSSGERYEKALAIRQNVAPLFLDAVLANIDLSRYALIGFTCLFDQTIASLALAKRIREKDPNILLAFGGYALQTPVGQHLQKAFPELMDVVAYGDGEPTIVPLYEAALGHRPLSDVPNISYFDADGVLQETPSARCNLDQNPTPDFDDYFRKREEMARVHKVRIQVPTMPLESSRGCWWGQKSHCVFCGIDEETMIYRAKSPERVIEELDELHQRYGAKNFRFSDYILPHRYFTTLLPELGRLKRPYRIQYESKSNLKPEYMDRMKEAGFFYVQLGVESFSTEVLDRMKKGVTGIGNIYSIRGLMKRGIRPYYNLLFGFPGDEAGDYTSMIERMPALYHLKAPGQCIWVQVTRFAPLASRSQDFGHSGKLRHHWRYDVLFSEELLQERNLDLAEICYSFESYNADMIAPDVQDLYLIFQEQWWRWRSREDSGSCLLTWRREEDALHFTDTRAGDKERQIRLEGVHKKVYELVDDEILHEKDIVQRSAPFSRDAVLSALEDLQRNQLVVREDSRYLGLAFPASVYEDGTFWWAGDNRWDGFLE